MDGEQLAFALACTSTSTRTEPDSPSADPTAGPAKVDPQPNDPPTGVERGGDAVRKKAVKDEDLDGVRSQAWFTSLIGAPTESSK